MSRISPRSSALAAALATILATSWVIQARGEAPASPHGLVVRVADPPAVAYEATALGRATHSLRLVLTNPGTKSRQVEPLAFHFRATRSGVTFLCEEPKGSDDRWPATLEPGTSFTLVREVTCETPLPGRYDVETLARPRANPVTPEETYGAFTMQIDPGANPPVRLPWAPSLHAAASGTKEVPPVKDPNKVRIIVAMINGTPAPVTLAPVHASLRVTRRDSRVPPCAEHGVDLAFSGSLAPGRSQALAAPLGCELLAEAVYDVDIAIASPSGTMMHVAKHSVRVSLIPPPAPRPEDLPRGKIYGSL